MSNNIRVLILDDDENASALLEYRLSEKFSNLEISVSDSPTPLPGFDIYFVDNDFDGESHLVEVVEQLRRQNPDSLCIAFSGCLHHDTLKRLVNAGCDHVCEKGQQQELVRTLDIVDDFVRNRPFARSDSGFLSTIRAVTDLFREWNRRMENSRARV